MRYQSYWTKHPVRTIFSQCCIGVVVILVARVETEGKVLGECLRIVGREG